MQFGTRILFLYVQDEILKQHSITNTFNSAYNITRLWIRFISCFGETGESNAFPHSINSKS